MLRWRLLFALAAILAGMLVAPPAGAGRISASDSALEVTKAGSTQANGNTARSDDVNAPTVIRVEPVDTEVSVSANSGVVATFDEPLADVNGHYAELSVVATGTNQEPITVAGQVSYDSVAKSVRFTPGGPLVPGTTYKAVASGAKDAVGNTMGPFEWSFTVAKLGPAPGLCPCSLWTDSDRPDVRAVAEAKPVNLGVRFRADYPGVVSGIRFYKGLGNSGVHVGALWSEEGRRLAEATFQSDAAAGWQEVAFADPVKIEANTTYVASYLAPEGHQGLTANAFAATGHARGMLHVLPVNGESRAGGVADGNVLTFPGTATSDNYWVDVVYEPEMPAPTGVIVTPSQGQVTVEWTPPAGATVSSYEIRAEPGGQVSTASADLTSASLSADKLEGIGPLTFTVTAVYSDGSMVTSLPSQAVTLDATPGAPAGVTAVRGDREATVAWQEPVDSGETPITSYVVTTTPGGGSVTVGGDQRTAVVPDLVNGTVYTFTVAAVNAQGQGPASDSSAAVTPAGRPGVPGDLKAMANCYATIWVTWDAPADTGGIPLTGFEVTAWPIGKSVTVGPAEIDAAITELTPGMAYTFTVSARNDVGASPAGQVPYALHAAVKPGVPSQVVASSTGDREVTVSWEIPTKDGGLPITGYAIEPTPTHVRTVYVGGSGTRSAKVTGLTNGTKYTFRVWSLFYTEGYYVGVRCFSPDPPPSNPVIAGAPDAPTGVTATVSGTEATVSWAAPAADAGDPVTSYSVTAAPGGQTVTVAAPNLTAVVSGLEAGTSYTFTITATNSRGTSPPSRPSGSVTAGLPKAPYEVRATAADSGATVKWKPPFDTGGAPITSYSVFAKPGSQMVTVPGTARSTTFTTLQNGTSYTFTVIARNERGDSPESMPSNTVMPGRPPAQPADVRAVAGNQRASVTWAKPAAADAVTEYTVKVQPSGREIAVRGDLSGTVVEGLTNGTAHTFTVTARNGFGLSTPSEPSNEVTPALGEAAPRNVTAMPGVGQVTVSWMAPDPQQDRTLVSYQVTSSPGGKQVPAEPEASQVTVTGLDNGQAYTFSVEARYDDDSSASSDPTPPVTPSTGDVVGVRSVSPAAAMADVSVDTKITVRFDRQVDLTLVATSLQMPSGAPVKGSAQLDADGQGLTFAPDRPLLTARDYTIRISLLGADGKATQVIAVSTFTTSDSTAGCNCGVCAPPTNPPSAAAATALPRVLALPGRACDRPAGRSF